MADDFQPCIVALMTDLADVGPDSVVLEIGTGFGYQAAVLAEIVEHVYTIEIVEPLGLRVADTLDRLGYDTVTVRVGDGYRGGPSLRPSMRSSSRQRPNKSPSR